jgi:hypothetical protein
MIGNQTESPAACVRKAQLAAERADPFADANETITQPSWLSHALAVIRDGDCDLVAAGFGVAVALDRG